MLRSLEKYRGIICVYAIVRTKTQEKYIGGATNLLGRVNAHATALQGNCHSNPKLQWAWNEDGRAGFNLEILQQFDIIDTDEIYRYECKFYDETSLRFNCRKPTKIVQRKNCTNRQIIFTSKLVENFYHRIVTYTNHDCWGWSGYTNSDGRAMIWNESKNRLAARVSYFIHTGTQPDSLYVCHTCDNIICTNPTHLFLGNAKDNSRDMVDKGRHRNGKVVFDWDTVRKMREMYCDGIPIKDIFQQFGKTSTCSHLLRNKSYYDPNYIPPPTRDSGVGTEINLANAQRVEIYGEVKTFKEWSLDSRCYIDKNSIKRRWDRGVRGAALIQKDPVITSANFPHPILLTAFGETKSVRDWIEDDRCAFRHRNTIRNRLNKGMSHQEAIGGVA